MGKEEQIPLIHTTTMDNNLNQHQKVTLTWSHIYVSCRERRTIVDRIRRVQAKSGRTLLNDLSGIARPGQILALIGASGIGKTTLLNVLSGCSDPLTTVTQGNVFLNGYTTTRSQRLSNSIIGYVEQREVFVETMTLEEHLIFEAMLRMPRSTTDEDRRMRVRTTVTLLSLDRCSKTTINKLSGGERKRLAFATILLCNPSVILIDEPTSGLDMYLAKSIMRMIRTLAIEQNRTIIVVLHQPSSEIYSMIDSLCLIVQGGRQAFFGARSDAIDFFTSACELTGPSLDDFIEQLVAPSDTENMKHQSSQVADYFDQSKHARLLTDEIFELSEQSNKAPEHLREIEWQSNMGRQLKWLMWRSVMSGARDPVKTTNVLSRLIIPAIMFGLIYFHLTYSPAYDQNVQAVIFVILMITLSASYFVIISSLPPDIHVYIKETNRRIYRTLPYYLTVLLRDLPLLLLIPFIFATVIYWLAGIDKVFIHYVEFVAIVALAGNTTAALGTLVSSFSSNVQSATATMVLISQIFSIFSGYFVSLPGISPIFYFIPAISPIFYGFTILQELETRWKPLNQKSQCNYTSSTASLNSTSAIDFWCDWKEKDLTLTHHSNIGFHISMLFLLYFIYHGLAFTIIWYRAHRSRLVDYWLMRKR